eukprot:g1752.t1
MHAQRAAMALREEEKQKLMHALYGAPKDPSLLANLASAFYHSKEKDAKHFSSDLLARCCEVGSRDPDVWKLRGDSHIAIWKEQRVARKAHLLHALSCYREALKSKKYSTDPNFLWDVAEVYRCYGSFEGALGVLSQIISTYKTFKAIHVVTHRAAVLLYRIGQYKDSLAYMKHCLLHPPKHYGEAYVLLQTARVFNADENPKAKRELLMKAHAHFIKQKRQNSSEHDCGRKNDDDFQQWAANPKIWIDAAQLYAKHGDHALAVDAFKLAADLNVDADGTQKSQKPSVVADFPYFDLAMSCRHIGDDSDAILHVRKWLKVHPSDRAARKAMELWTKAESPKEMSTVTLRTGMTLRTNAFASDPQNPPSSPSGTLRGTKSTIYVVHAPPKSKLPRNAKMTMHKLEHPISWLSQMYKPPPTAIEIARKRAEEIAKKKAAHERAITDRLREKKKQRRSRIGPKETAAMLIQSAARRRHNVRTYKNKRRRRRRKYAIVLQKYARRLNAIERVKRMRDEKIKKEQSLTRTARENAIARVNRDMREASKIEDGASDDAASSYQTYTKYRSDATAYANAHVGAFAEGGGQEYATWEAAGGYASAGTADYGTYDNAQYSGIGGAGNWTECFDEQSGRRYYYNPTTGETQWA